MNENSKGIINDVLLEVDFNLINNKVQFIDVTGKFNCSNITITYMENMPEISDINGVAKIENSKVTFNIHSGNSENITVSSGEIDLYDLDTDFEKAKINLNLIAQNNYVVEYLEFTEIDQNNYSKLNDIFGKVNLNLKLDFPLLVDLKAEEINYSANAKILDGNYNLLDNKYVIESFEIDIEVNPDVVNFIGKGDFFDSKVEFSGNQIIKGSEIVDEIEGKIMFNFNTLENILSQKVFEYSSGILPINFSFIASKDDFKFEGIGEMDQLDLVSEFLGKNLNFTNGKVRFVISPYGENISGFIDIKTQNLDIEINSILSELELQNLEVLKFKSPVQDFSLSMNSKKITDVKIEGKKISIPTIKFNEDSFLNKFDEIKFDMNLSEIVIGMSKFYDPVLWFEKKRG